jgi:hypothetical protein
MSLPSKPNATFIKNNPHLYPPTQTAAAMLGNPTVIIRQSTKPKLNKTEAAFLESLEHTGHDTIHVQAITLTLANGVRYTPDFVCTTTGGSVYAYEVKGFMRDDAAVKIKVAAKEYPWISFCLVVKRKGGWSHQQVYP